MTAVLQALRREIWIAIELRYPLGNPAGVLLLLLCVLKIYKMPRKNGLCRLETGV
jgi:hypothetical protein